MPNKVDNLSTKMASALFTIEQIELIRRLRNSGITKEQVSMAFDQMDRLDIELGKPSTSNRSNIPQYPTICSSLQALDRIDQDSNPVQSQMTNGVSKNELFYNKNQGESYSRPQSSSNSSTDGATDNGQNGDAISPVANNNSSSPTSRLSNELTIIPLSSSSAPSVPVSYSSADGVTVQSHIYNSRSADGASNCVPIQCLVNPLDLLQDECYELDELKKKGEMNILSEIRNFVMRYNIKQTMIAEMTKMSQAYVSRFFRGDIQDMSDRTKNAFYMWYLTCKNNPWKLTQLCPNSGVKRMVSESGDLIPLKRERFTFKAAHLAVLERYYEKDPYPDSQTREQIVDECNKAVERAVRVSDRPLAERERVTLPVVNNWFNNRRKEAKKQLRQQHAAAMAAVSVSMSPLGQPSMGLPSVASMPSLSWHQSPGLGGMTNFVGAQQPAFHPNAQLDLSSEAMDSDSSRDSYGNGDALSVEDNEKPANIKQEV
ncbi:homeobox-containing protein 1-like isoform X1 [Argiope bruennichi]|uniref:Homeobox-containing protein 1 n=1 Tax=Argiope bruennichi TaxID=94029 RepID=A0A8T0ETH1_ARGBR|nr:homeobox-containing protein 1-like isoform X1 [Argiope bruennichi]KAF8781596.1 Homeobox-containing protein 1 [Argiope bruennichi]